MKFSIVLDDWYFQKSIQCVDCEIECKQGCEYCECPLLEFVDDAIDYVYGKDFEDD